MKCEICGKDFLNQMALSVHISKMHNYQLTKCNICGKEVKYIGRHIISCHKDINQQDYYNKYIRKENEGICPVCKKPTTFLGITKGYRDHCSVTCSSLDPNVQIKNANTNLKLHGYTNPLIQPEIHKKAVEKSKSPESKQKRQDTCNRLYNAPHNWSSPMLLERTAKKIYEKWGVDHISKVPELQQKAHENQRKKHNGKLAWNSPKQQETMLKRYGKLNPLIYYTYQYDNIFFDSSWELAVYIYFKDAGIILVREPVNLIYYDENNKKCIYIPDFQLEDNRFEDNYRLIEIKGDNLINKDGYLIDPKTKQICYAKTKCMWDNNVYLMSREECKPCIKYCQEKFNDKKWYKQFIYHKNKEK